MLAPETRTVLFFMAHLPVSCTLYIRTRTGYVRGAILATVLVRRTRRTAGVLVWSALIPRRSRDPALPPHRRRGAAAHRLRRAAPRRPGAVGATDHPGLGRRDRDRDQGAGRAPTGGTHERPARCGHRRRRAAAPAPAEPSRARRGARYRRRADPASD